ncbi:MAG TPA: response regulator, partial [Bacteroidales bacterium]|nr:response regulator [Bacteroidales bacterium]
EKAILTVIPKSLVPLQKTQTIQLSDVLLQGKSIFSADTKTKVEYIDNQYHIYLSGKEDNIAIYFSDFEWNIQNNNEYEYILENYMDDWALLHDANFVNFTKLSGGDYVLRIKKKYQDSSSHDELVVHIHIQKAFWEYWFFYVSLVLLLIGLIYIIYIVRVQSIISMRNSLQQQVEQRMSEIQNKIERIQEQEERIRQQDADFLIQQEIQSKLEQDIETQKQTYELAIQQKDIEIEESKKQTQAVSELKELVEKNFHLLENNTREMVFRIILPSEMFDYVSPAVESFTGYTPQEFYSDSMMFRKLIISEGKDDFKKFRKYMIEGKVPPVMEYKIITKSGKEKWVAQYSTIIRDAKQQPIALEAVLVDISEKKELEQRNNALKKRAKKLEKIEGDFSETQNINTVKQALHVFADLLKREDVSLDEKQAFLESNQESGSFALHMIENFIDISKIEAGKIHFNYSQCYVNTVLQELLDSFTESKQYIGKKHIQLTMNVPSLEENFSFYTDTFRFRQVMMNLLGNAIKFTHSGSVEFGYEIIENVKAENNIELVFFVKDTGEGIPAEKLDLLFNTDMQSEDSEFMGGLGLTVSKKIVELLGGRMWAESELEKGTIIRFTLPVEKMKGFKKAEQQVTEKLVETIDWSQKTLLLVEDEENNYDLVREVLAKTNIQILWAQNGEEGVEMFKQNQRDIDVILMDIQMPIMNGYTATQEIKKIDKDIPIIAQTAYANYDSKLNCIKVGCENYIEKPYKRKDLIDMLSKYL